MPKDFEKKKMREKKFARNEVIDFAKRIEKTLDKERVKERKTLMFSLP